jgi:hypothetical protein
MAKDFAADYRERAVGGQPRATLPSFRSEVCNFEQTLWAARQSMPTRRRRTNLS